MFNIDIVDAYSMVRLFWFNFSQRTVLSPVCVADDWIEANWIWHVKVNPGVQQTSLCFGYYSTYYVGQWSGISW